MNELEALHDKLTQSELAKGEAIMGKRKADIFISGDMSLDRFVDANGRELRMALSEKSLDGIVLI